MAARPPAFPNPPKLAAGPRVYLVVEVESLIAMLPNVVMSIREEQYEHLDTMWADTAKDTVFPKVTSLTFRFLCSQRGA